MQAYIGDPAAAGEPPEQLKGFERVTLAPGQSAYVDITLGSQCFFRLGHRAPAVGRDTGELHRHGRRLIAHLPLKASISIG